MTEITTVPELDALPVGAVVADCDGDIWVRRLDCWAFRSRDGIEYPTRYLVGEVASFGPLRPLPSPELRMTRYCGHDCQTATPLPIGASWLCPLHGGTNDTTGGN